MTERPRKRLAAAALSSTPISPSPSTTGYSSTAPVLPSPRHEPAFEMIVLGCGGGPLETDCSGYIVKPVQNRWEDGIIGLEGGSGIGALATLLATRSPAHLFPSVIFPETYNTPVLKAAYIFSFLSCYLITHAHLDHALSLVMLSGSAPPRPRNVVPSDSIFKSSSFAAEPFLSSPVTTEVAPIPQMIPVYATRGTLINLAGAWAGRLWPELARWADEEGTGEVKLFAESVDEAMKIEGEEAKARELRKPKKRKRSHSDNSGVGVKFSPLEVADSHRQLEPSLPVTTQIFPVSHGHTSQGTYPSSAVFVRYDPSVLFASVPQSRRASESNSASVAASVNLSRAATETSVPPQGAVGREFLFFGDVESAWRAVGEEDVESEFGLEAEKYNRDIWKQAASSITAGRLAAIFIECSYDSARQAHQMYGHLSPPGIFHELQTLASMLPTGPLPLAGIALYITHVKEFLVPHVSGRTARELVRSELDQLEAVHKLGVDISVLAPGDRILI